MKRRMIGFIVGAFIASATNSLAGVEVPKVVFDCYYVSFAWGYELSGIYINSKGDVFKYNRNGNEWLPPSVKEGASVHPESELLEKYMNAQVIGHVDKAQLKEKIKLIIPASEGAITRTPAMKDAGGRGCVAYTFDSDRRLYKEIKLGSIGNFTTVNSATEAQELSQWLKEYWELEKNSK